MILLAGGTGNIGSHTVVDLLKRGKSVLILDNLCYCSSKVEGRIRANCAQRLLFLQENNLDKAVLAPREVLLLAYMDFEFVHGTIELAVTLLLNF